MFAIDFKKETEMHKITVENLSVPASAAFTVMVARVPVEGERLYDDDWSYIVNQVNIRMNPKPTESVAIVRVIY